jgi:hypothetical protein
LPYGVKVHITDEWFYDKIEPYDRRLDCDVIKNIRENQYTVKPYLRPMSSMTEEEKFEYGFITERWMYDATYSISDSVDWLNANHFDYRGLVEKGLALVAPEGMYKNI